LNKKIALLSVSDKTGIVALAKALVKNDWQIVATSQTADFLRQQGIATIPVSEFGGFPEILDGRVKTLQPKIFAGILADRKNPQHCRQMKKMKIIPIDLVAVNFYQPEKIDIGGVALLRAAAKNYPNVIALSDPLDYPRVIQQLESKQDLSLAWRRQLAARVFARTAYYDTLIANQLNNQVELYPDKLTLALKKISPLRYGENPHQSAAIYQAADSANNYFQLISGKELSFNNYLDLFSGYQLVQEFSQPACAIIKHTNPCGVALAKNPVLAYRLALASDRQSAFGGVVSFNRPIDEKTAGELAKMFIECIIAPGYTPAARAILTRKKNLRLIICRAKKFPKSPELRSIFDYILLEERDNKIWDRIKIVTKKSPTTTQLKNLKFAFTVCKYVKSNAIVLATNYQTVGIGAGQMSRIDALKIAAKKMARLKIKKKDSLVLASDGFFPFPDVVRLAGKIGVKAIVEPGGSIRDKESIVAADRLGLSMIFTGIRHFRH